MERYAILLKRNEMEKKHSQAHYKDNNVIIRDEPTQKNRCLHRKLLRSGRSRNSSRLWVFLFVFFKVNTVINVCIKKGISFVSRAFIILKHPKIRIGIPFYECSVVL